MTLGFFIHYTIVTFLKKEGLMKYWSKSALSIYHYLEAMSKTIDKLVLDTGKSSNNKELSNYQTTYCQTGKIIKLTDRKRKLINLKIIVEDGLARISKESRRILTLFYIDGIKSNMVAQLLGISIRTFFRQKLKALEDFSQKLLDIGYDEEFFKEDYLCERWFEVVYNDMVTKNYDEEDYLEGSIIKTLLGSVAKMPLYSNTYV